MSGLNPSIRSRFLFSPCFSWVQRCLKLQLTVSTVSAGRVKTVETVSETKTERPSTQLKQGVNEISRTGRASRASVCLLLTAFCLLAGAGCRVDMQDQPKMKPYRSSPFYKDGLSSRQLVPGTVPRGWLREDK